MIPVSWSLIGRPRPALGGVGEYLVPGLGDTHGVLELRRERAVLGNGGPAVREDLHLEAAGIHHRLYREEHARLEHGPVLGCAEMQDRGRVVEDAADAMPAEIAHHR